MVDFCDPCPEFVYLPGSFEDDVYRIIKKWIEDALCDVPVVRAWRREARPAGQYIAMYVSECSDDDAVLENIILPVPEDELIDACMEINSAVMATVILTCYRTSSVATPMDQVNRLSLRSKMQGTEELLAKNGIILYEFGQRVNHPELIKNHYEQRCSAQLQFCVAVNDVGRVPYINSVELTTCGIDESVIIDFQTDPSKPDGC